MLAMIWRFPGDSTDIFLPEVLSTQLPSISICARLPVVAAVVLLIATTIAATSYQSSSLAPDCSPLLSREHICLVSTGEAARKIVQQWFELHGAQLSRPEQ